MSTLETNLIRPSTGTSLTIGESGDTTNIVGTLQNNGAGVGGANTPSFLATLSSNQSISDATFTKIQFNTEVFDTDNAYDNSSNFRFTPQTAGKYLVNAVTSSNSGTNSDILRVYQTIRKNGSQFQLQNMDTRDGGGFRVMTISSSLIVNMNGSSDYLEVYVYADSNSGNAIGIGGGSDDYSLFQAFKLIGV